MHGALHCSALLCTQRSQIQPTLAANSAEHLPAVPYQLTKVQPNQLVMIFMVHDGPPGSSDGLPEARPLSALLPYRTRHPARATLAPSLPVHSSASCPSRRRRCLQREMTRRPGCNAWWMRASWRALGPALAQGLLLLLWPLWLHLCSQLLRWQRQCQLWYCLHSL